MTTLRHENIGRFDVTMNDAFGVSSVQGLSDFNCQREQNIRLDGFSINAVL